MLKHTFTTTAFAALMLSSAFAQSGPPAPGKTTPMPAPSTTAPQSHTNDSFLHQQVRADWRASKLIGTSVVGLNNSKIGDINDLVIDNNGTVHAVVIGVGGVLGVGEKNVAIPLKSLVIKQSPTGDKFEKLSVSFTLDQLKNAPEFKWAQAPAVSPSDKRSDNLPRK
jgi:sporulation protein YlmC with PRC-barrel domain